MDTIDFSYTPPVFHKNCEGCDLCSGICPTGAISINNFAEVHGTKMHTPEKVTDVYTGFYEGLNNAKAIGKFRPLVPIHKIGFDTPLSTVKRIPLFVLKEKDFPYHINEGWSAEGV
ncbi:MAG: 4Fe-4S binding protein [Deltaproteobacteria bacterium]|nr:4Fe-4S binding protein [Deltaproteobacteria bacterium]